MILRFDDWAFDVRFQETAEDSKFEVDDHCMCGYCRNFYEGVDSAYPNLRAFLGSFGLNIEAPNELMPYVEGDTVHYYGVFAVCGVIVDCGVAPFVIDGIQIKPTPYNDQQINYGCSDPCFFLEFSDVVLKWTQDESIEDVESPANDPDFIAKIWQRIFGASSGACIS